MKNSACNQKNHKEGWNSRFCPPKPKPPHPRPRTCKNIAYIQNVNLLTNKQISKYMKKIKYLTSQDPLQMYKFIVSCNKVYKITNFCLNINSGNLLSLSSLIEQNRKLDNCIFAATCSNSNEVRDVSAKNIYYSLSSLSVLLSSFTNVKPNNVMTIVSNQESPFYTQLLLEGPKPAYQLKDLTVEKLNEFTMNGGSNLLIALSLFELEGIEGQKKIENEFEVLNNFIMARECEYTKFATYVELLRPEIQYANKLTIKLNKVFNIASNVSIIGSTDRYEGVNSLTLYDNSAIQLVNTYPSWPLYVTSSVLEKPMTMNDNAKSKKAKGDAPATTQFLTTLAEIFAPFPLQ